MGQGHPCSQGAFPGPSPYRANVHTGSGGDSRGHKLVPGSGASSHRRKRQTFCPRAEEHQGQRGRPESSGSRESSVSSRSPTTCHLPSSRVWPLIPAEGGISAASGMTFCSPGATLEWRHHTPRTVWVAGEDVPSSAKQRPGPDGTVATCNTPVSAQPPGRATGVFESFCDASLLCR